jgi:hypothetical protein
MAYVDLTYYTDTYKGFVVPSNAFDYYAERATDEINNHLNIDEFPVAEIDDKVKKCTCQLIDSLYNFDNKKELSSESVGSYSRSFNVQKSTKTDVQANYDIVCKWLWETGYLFRGYEDVY